MIAVVIPSHNRRVQLLATLKALPPGARPVVVLDGCSDGSEQAVREQFPDAEILTHPGDLWWTGSVNLGLERALQLGLTKFCILNDDVTVAPDMLTRLEATHAQNPGALVGPRILFADRPEVVWSAGGSVSWLGRGAQMRANECPLSELPDRVERVDWLPGMGTFFDRATLLELGFPDARRFPQYFGDTDFSLRASKRGLPVLVCPRAYLYNDLGSTGLLLPKGPLTLNQARQLFTSLRSHSHLVIRWRFLQRHCPLPLIPWQLLRFYGPLALVVLKKLVLRA